MWDANLCHIKPHSGCKRVVFLHTLCDSFLTQHQYKIVPDGDTHTHTGILHTALYNFRLGNNGKYVFITQVQVQLDSDTFSSSRAQHSRMNNTISSHFVLLSQLDSIEAAEILLKIIRTDEAAKLTALLQLDIPCPWAGSAEWPVEFLVVQLHTCWASLQKFRSHASGGISSALRWPSVLTEMAMGISIICATLCLLSSSEETLLRSFDTKDCSEACSDKTKSLLTFVLSKSAK